MPSGRWCVTWRTKNWRTGESNPSTSLHRSRGQHQLIGLRDTPVGWWMAEKPGAEGNPRSPGENLPLSC